MNTLSMIKIKLLAPLILILFSCFTTSAHAEVTVGKTYYTQYNFMYEKGRHVTTNYWRGILVPINSKAKLVSLDGQTMTLEIDGQNIKIVNVEKHTQRNIQAIANELLSTNRSKVSGKFANDIKTGNLRLGMTKKQVIQTRGYPPRHKTPSTKSSLWVFWSSKFVQLSLAFDGNRLVKGRGLR